MLLYLDRLEEELKNILHFWAKYAYYDNHERIYPEVSIEGAGNKNSDMGTIFLSRILYGTSASCNFLKTDEYAFMADTAFNILQKNFKNPAGGYYWGLDGHGNPLHDNENVSFAQAFVVYGLSEYYQFTRNNDVYKVLRNQIDFIENTLYDYNNGGYLDGFDERWQPIKKQIKSLATHLHLMEAYVKFIRIEENEQIKAKLRELLELVITRIINTWSFEAIHTFDILWKPQPNENWLGHNMEISWLICEAAHALKNPELIAKCEKLAVELVNANMSIGFDNQYGGIYNIFKDNKPITENKEAWPQAETVIALINVFQINRDKKMLNDAIRMFEFIDGTISDGNRGEWYDSVAREGRPCDVPKLHFWKSMYHNVRYCIELSNRLKKIIP